MEELATLSQGAGRVLGSPLRLLTGTLLYVAVVFIVATLGYIASGWPPGDAAYMVLLTIFSVGYGEVRPVDTHFLRLWTTATIVLGCTGMIVLTSALVQVFTLFQFRQLLGVGKMQSDIDKLKDHAIICGMGRIGLQLAKALTEARHPFILIERTPEKAEEARALGWLVMVGEATQEETLRAAGIGRARVLASVLPDDAANVFITLSARSLNPDVQIIARGEAPTTERKLFHAGADKVVLPTHIGAERITELILYPATDTRIQEAEHLADARRFLHDLGLDVEVVTAVPKGALTGATVGEAERRSAGAFFIVQIDRASGQSIQHPGEDVNIEPGDTLVLVVRGTRLSAGAIFGMPAKPVKQGRTYLG